MASAWSLERNQLLVGAFVHSKTREELEVLEDAAVAVDKGGKIVGVQTGCETSAAAKQQLLGRLGWSEADVDLIACKPGQFFFPGFIDTHVHAPQYPNVGIFGKTTVLDWLQKYTFPLEASLKDLAKARRVYTACVRRTLAHGTTTAAYFATIDVAATNLLADLCLGLGQRALIGRVCMDTPGICPDYYRDESAEESLRATLETIAHVKRIDADYEIVSPILTPRFAPSCSGPSMLGLADLHRRQGLPIQTHISEHADDVKLATDLFPESGSYAKIYDDHGLLTAKTILAHAVHLTEGEATLVAARGAKVAHCPCSNACLTSGEARVRWLWDRGIDVGLGTDMSGGYSPSVLEAARQAALVSRYVAMPVPSGDARERCKLSVDEVLYLATRGGAEVVGLAHKVGGFEVGMHWDAQLVELNLVSQDGGEGAADKEEEDGFRDGGNVDVFGWETWEERVTKWLYNGDDRNTKKVWVKGRLVHSRP
ncbi:amidohydrolase family protein [Hirsutella rhossiliensis]|uniref:Probable guanine deaminase n=1 Tax=Hirsutella rhossiliensis TaxID=111463 RepID=A0A9P8MY82_9HYPO|nr:amidohydrolase family domain-containing protein [Hirsutella rhossiliensis]KAH0964523.1 amidohydrolase family domain-containing protein [Hirsutella rhossiliensis]